MSKTFSSFSLPTEVLQVLTELEIKIPTEVQEKAIPILLEGKDLLAQSKTGSGKTFAYLLPCFAKLRFDLPEAQVLVLCPTRELSTQVAKEAKKLGRKYPELSVANLVGGQPIGPQYDFLRKGSQIVVGTPGRVLDHIRKGSLNLDHLEVFILDEADRMLDMGFEEEMQEVFSEAPRCQLALFSATFPDSLRGMLEHLADPVRVHVADVEKVDFLHEAMQVDNEEKLDALLAVLLSKAPEQAIVFCHQKETVNQVCDFLQSNGVDADFLHGDLEQQDRDQVMAKFRNFSIRVLVATDIASRGIDVAGLDLVVNYDFPKPDIYVHRAGRSGRAGRPGAAFSFFHKGEKYKLKEMEIDFQMVEKLPPAAIEELPAKMYTLGIFAGRKDKLRPGDLLGALTGEAGGLKASEVGKIEIMDRFSFVAIARDKAEHAYESLMNGKVKGKEIRLIKL
jgi:ATP-independent RNA helicase DbpA